MDERLDERVIGQLAVSQQDALGFAAAIQHGRHEGNARSGAGRRRRDGIGLGRNTLNRQGDAQILRLGQLEGSRGIGRIGSQETAMRIEHE